MPQHMLPPGETKRSILNQYFLQRQEIFQEALLLSLKMPCKIVADIIFFLSEKKRLDFSCHSSARKIIYMKCQALFSMKNGD